MYVPAKEKRFAKSFYGHNGKTALQAVLCICRKKNNFLQNRFTVIRQNDFASRFMYVPEKEQLFAKSFYG
ncbi:MAG: hypothetical protein BWK80_06410 [Desulfobacteraceae bacterium IS3]|nr:MAG: hypothetical protein BWK80_06410 [Desulfobacteraceae bacterium IS3]